MSIMIGLKRWLLAEERRLVNIIAKLEIQLESTPEGSLGQSKSGKNQQFYQRMNGKRTYIRKENYELVRQLAQKDYDKKALKVAKRSLEDLRKYLAGYEDKLIEQVFRDQTTTRQQLVDPVEMLWEIKLQNWLDEEYEGLGFNENDPLTLTDKGLRVRSKSERTLAEYFDKRGIPYKYEKPLRLEGYGTVYPDFTFLSPRTGKEIYWEHEGMMDEVQYARNAVNKILAYERIGIFPGENLILTFETEKTILNIIDVEMLVDRYLV